MLHCKYLLLTQSGHRLALQSCTLNVFNFEQNLRAPYQKIGEAVRAANSVFVCEVERGVEIEADGPQEIFQ